MSNITYASTLDEIESIVKTEVFAERHLTADDELTFYVHSILNDGCYECETGQSAGPVNEAGGGECMAGYTFVEYIINGKHSGFAVSYGLPYED